MTSQLIITILSFILILFVFKLIYLEKNPLQMTRFWLIQIAIAAIWWVGMANLELTLIIPYISSFLLILLGFKIANWKKNPFKSTSFWITQTIVAIVITAAIFFIFLCALGGGDSYEDNLADDIAPETITSITQSFIEKIPFILIV